MYAIAEQVRTWLAEGHDVRVAQIVAVRGLASRDPALASAWHDGADPVGVLADGVPAVRLDDQGLVELEISDADARAGGLACGGLASVLVQPASAFPAELWDRLVASEPVCITTAVGGGDPVDSAVFTPETIRGADEFGGDIARLFGRGSSATALVEDEYGTRAVVCLWPVPDLVVVGDGLIADALAAQAALLGWTFRQTLDVAEAVALVGGTHRSDAVVVLSHDRATDGPVLTAALAGGAGYVGALGSRRTQGRRREWLTANGVPDTDVDRIHGPAGLDIDAHTPAEIAVSIVAEILGSRGRTVAGALRDRPGPVHAAGVQAPPPRYVSD